MYLHKDDRELLLDIINTVSNISGVRTASSPFQPNLRDKYTLPPRGFHQKPQAAAENYEKQ
mgnify:CR=1 FL=1